VASFFDLNNEAPLLADKKAQGDGVLGRPGVRKIAERFGVNASTAQAISSGL